MPDNYTKYVEGYVESKEEHVSNTGDYWGQIEYGYGFDFATSRYADYVDKEAVD